MCVTLLSGRQYKKICQQVKLIVKNLRSKNPEFIEHFLTKVENNSLLLGLENASKNTQKLALKAMTLSYKSGADTAAKAFAKEGIILLPNEIAFATENSLKMSVGPKIRNFSIKIPTRQLVTEHRLALIQKREENLCQYDNEKITISHYFTCPLMRWITDILQKALLHAFSVIDDTITTLTIGRKISKAYNSRVKNRGNTVQSLFAISRFFVHTVHLQNTKITNKDILIDIFKNLLNMHTVGETKKDTTKVILSLDFFPVKYISTQDDTNQNINNKTIFYSKEQEKLWIAQTVRATN